MLAPFYRTPRAPGFLVCFCTSVGPAFTRWDEGVLVDLLPADLIRLFQFVVDFFFGLDCIGTS